MRPAAESRSPLALISSADAVRGVAMPASRRSQSCTGIWLLAIGVAAGLALALGGCAAARQRAKPPASDPTLSRLIEQLGSPDDEKRTAAMESLQGLGRSAVPALVTALKHPSEQVRWGAAEVLREIGSPDAVEGLIAALGDSSSLVRQSAVEALGQIGDRRAAQPLIQLYDREEDAQVRYECLTSLGRIGDPAAADLLLRESRSSDPYARMWAVDAMCTMGDARAADLALSALRDPNRYVRRQIAYSCARFYNSPAAYAALVDVALQDDDFQTGAWARQHLATALRSDAALAAEVRNRGAAALEASQRRGDGAGRVRAALLLGEAGDRRAVPALIEALGDQVPLVRQDAARLLGRVGDRRAVEPLVKALQDQWTLVRATAYNSLQWLAEDGDPKAKEAVANYKGVKFQTRLPR